MGKYVQRITHKGKQILFADFANKGEEASLAVWDELKQELLKERGGVLVLIDATNTPVSLEILNKAKGVAATLKSIPGTRVAFVGMSTLQKSSAQVHARAIHLNVHFCQTMEEGKEWLVKEDEKSQKR